MLTLFKIRLRQRIYAKKTSWPYLSGDAFKELCREVDNSNYIFVKSDDLDSALARLKHHTKPFVLIVGNGDRDFNDLQSDFPKNLVKIYIQNSHLSDGKFIATLPIGIENLRHGMNGLPSLFDSEKRFSDKINKVLIGPFGNTHQIRETLMGFSDSDSIHVLRSRLTARQYSKIARDFKYVACPRGNGEDTHRVWETLYRNSVPIVLENAWSNSLQSLGLPIIAIPEWTEQAIEEVVTSNSNLDIPIPKNLSALWMTNWEKKFSSNLIDSSFEV